MADHSDRSIGGYTLEALLGAAPVEMPKKKPRRAGRALGAPFRAAGHLVKLPVIAIGRLAGGLVNAVGEIARLPVRVAGALVKPWRSR